MLYEECLCYNFPEFEKVVQENISKQIGNLAHIVKNGELYSDTRYDEENENDDDDENTDWGSKSDSPKEKKT